MAHKIPTVIEENVHPNFNNDDRSGIMRRSVDSLSSLSHPGDSTSLDLNDDLMSGDNQSSILALSRRSFESSSFVTSSFRPSFDDSLPLLGLNRLSIQKLSPLGPNSIYEIVADVDSKKTTSSTLSPNTNRNHSKKSLHIRPPTQKDIPTIHLTKIEKASKEELKQYLSDIGKEYEKYSSNKKLTTTTLESFVKKQNSNGNDHNDLLEKEIDSLDTVPEVYFKNEFNLDDPRVFKSVTEGNKIDNLNSLAQDKLSWYLDTIEVHLVNEISKSSSSFFDALNDLNDISLKNQSIVELIGKLRSKLDSLTVNKIEKNLEKIKLINKRQNVAKLEQGLLQVNTVLNESDIAESLFLKGEYEKCLDQVDYVESLIRGEVTNLKWPFKLQDLRSVPALVNMRELLCNLRIQTGQSYSKIFTNFLLEDLRIHYEDINYLKVVERLANNSTYEKKIDDDFKSKLNEFIIGLTRCEEIASAFKNYEEQTVNEMKNIVRFFLPNEEADSTEFKNGTSSIGSSNRTSGKSLSAMIKSLTPREFEDMVIKIYATVSEGLRRLTVHQKLLLDLALSNIKQQDQDQINLIMQLDIRNCINKSIEIVQIRMGKIITVRKDINASLRYDYFLRFFYINSIFLNESENISGLNFKFLPDVITSQIKNFNLTFHHHNLKKVSHSLEVEEWKPLIVTPQLQNIVSKIVDNENLDLEQHWKKDLLHLRGQKDENSADKTESADQQQMSHKRSIVVGDKTFVASNSLLVLIEMIQDYFILKSNFHHYSHTYEQYLIELFKYYNSRSFASIKKGDGTLDRNKNLSIVGESLDCLQELIHYIRIDFDNLDLDELYNAVINNFGVSKSKIDSINTIDE